MLVEMLEGASIDGLDPRTYKVKALKSAIKKARGGSPAALARADFLLSQAFAAYASDMRRPRSSSMLIAEPALFPSAPDKTQILTVAAAAPSLSAYLDNAGWMHPLYGPLRKSLASAPRNSPQEQLIRLNLDRARNLPGPDRGRHVVVDAAGARLFMYENGRVVDTMKVVVGKEDTQTPIMAGMIRYATVSPYWNIPPDLVRERIASNVLDRGLGYLKEQGYEVLSDWSPKAGITNPKLVNWKSVAAGGQQIRVRQRPGGSNAMGRVKFEFPNELGIYLHDTPERNLFQEADRRYSAGCVRVEDAPRLARWLFGKPLALKSKTPEKRVDLPEPVPVYITYLTAFPEASGIAFRQDRYRLDAAALGGGQRVLAGR